MPSFTFAIPDIHGHNAILRKALNEIENRHSGGTIVFLGDYIDRGPNSKGVLDTLISGPISPDWSWITLAGNHERMPIYGMRSKKEAINWMLCGGYETLESYGEGNSKIPSHHLHFLKSLPEVYQDEHRIYVHAGFDHSTSTSEQSEETLLWSTYPDEFDEPFNARHIVHGHLQYNEPLLLTNRTCLDTGAFKSDILHIGVFEDATAGGPINIMEIHA
jgi:serine/threonine protein phosphatase 1